MKRGHAEDHLAPSKGCDIPTQGLAGASAAGTAFFCLYRDTALQGDTGHNQAIKAAEHYRPHCNRFELSTVITEGEKWAFK